MEFTRRQFLSLSVVGATGLAGCSSAYYDTPNEEATISGMGDTTYLDSLSATYEYDNNYVDIFVSTTFKEKLDSTRIALVHYAGQTLQTHLVETGKQTVSFRIHEEHLHPGAYTFELLTANDESVIDKAYFEFE